MIFSRKSDRRVTTSDMGVRARRRDACRILPTLPEFLRKARFQTLSAVLLAALGRSSPVSPHTSSGTAPSPKFWSSTISVCPRRHPSSCGGVKSGEELEDAVLREVAEETGLLTATVVRQIAVGASPILTPVNHDEPRSSFCKHQQKPAMRGTTTSRATERTLVLSSPAGSSPSLWSNHWRTTKTHGWATLTRAGPPSPSTVSNQRPAPAAEYATPQHAGLPVYSRPGLPLGPEPIRIRGPAYRRRDQPPRTAPVPAPPGYGEPHPTPRSRLAAAGVPTAAGGRAFSTIRDSVSADA